MEEALGEKKIEFIGCDDMGNGVIAPRDLDSVLEPRQGNLPRYFGWAPRSRNRTRGRRSAEKTVGKKPLFGNSMEFTGGRKKFLVGRSRELL